MPTSAGIKRAGLLIHDTGKAWYSLVWSTSSYTATFPDPLLGEKLLCSSETDHTCHIWRMLLVFSRRKRTKKLLSVLGDLIIKRRRKDVTTTCRSREASVCCRLTTRPGGCAGGIPSRGRDSRIALSALWRRLSWASRSSWASQWLLPDLGSASTRSRTAKYSDLPWNHWGRCGRALVRGSDSTRKWKKDRASSTWGVPGARWQSDRVQDVSRYGGDPGLACGSATADRLNFLFTDLL